MKESIYGFVLLHWLEAVSYTHLGTNLSYSKINDVDVSDGNSETVILQAITTPSVVGKYNADGTFPTQMCIRDRCGRVPGRSSRSERRRQVADYGSHNGCRIRHFGRGTRRFETRADCKEMCIRDSYCIVHSLGTLSALFFTSASRRVGHRQVDLFVCCSDKNR